MMADGVTRRLKEARECSACDNGWRASHTRVIGLRQVLPCTGNATVTIVFLG